MARNMFPNGTVVAAPAKAKMCMKANPCGLILPGKVLSAISCLTNLELEFAMVFYTSSHNHGSQKWVPPIVVTFQT